MDYCEGGCVMRGVFITGSDTGVGKTVVGAALAWRLASEGLVVRPRKPVESGCVAGEGGMSGDRETYHAAVGGREPLARIGHYRFRAALSPERAAALEGRTVRLDDLIQACREGVGPGDFLLVEGAGGFYSPLASDGLNADLAAALGLPVLVVSADRLGAIHQALLTTEAVARRGLTLAGVVLNETVPGADPRMNNGVDVARWLGRDPVLIRYHKDADGLPTWRAIAPSLTAVVAALVTDAGG
ncbi:dethiobiotin synthase [Acidiferrobacter sp. SPIII_3]|uniref:dethiobiotin synthase n=1 Tax=Acidiferrobacter sp. SPIII_3 TaxID=1281578 RepID=UPI000D72C1BB|nr:dethiobiotin synthase [Acidiferrobacter sp. SPIII_3]AWP24464.1 dethiobiotin synthase [Acidiferrobacter sp. SPIII_3]